MNVLNPERMGADAVIVGNYEISMVMTDKRTIRITGYVFNLDTPEEVNRRLDIAQDAIERQFVRCDITTKEAQRESFVVAIAQHRDKVAGLVERKNAAAKDGRKLNAQERAQVDHLEADLKNFYAQVEGYDAAIAKAKMKLNGAHAA